MTIQPLETERLLLRFFTRDDEAIHRLVFADPQVAVPFCRATRTIGQVRDWLVCRAFQTTVDEFGFWAVVRKRDGALLGLVGLQAYVPDWAHCTRGEPRSCAHPPPRRPKRRA